MRGSREPEGEYQDVGSVEIAALVEQHYEAVFRFAWRLSGGPHEAADLTQQTFLDAQRKLDTLRDESRVRAWLFMIVRNLYRRQLRDRVTHREVGIDGDPAVLCEPVDSVALDSQSLQEALDALPEEFRSVLVLFYFGELSYRDIAEQLDLPLGTVMSRLSRGKHYLRQRLNPDSY